MAEPLTKYEQAIVEQAADTLQRGKREIAARIGRSEPVVYNASNGKPVSEYVRDEILSYCCRILNIDLDYQALMDEPPAVRQAATHLIAEGLAPHKALRSARSLGRLFESTPSVSESA